MNRAAHRHAAAADNLPVPAAPTRARRARDDLRWFLAAHLSLIGGIRVAAAYTIRERDSFEVVVAAAMVSIGVALGARLVGARAWRRISGSYQDGALPCARLMRRRRP